MPMHPLSLQAIQVPDPSGAAKEYADLIGPLLGGAAAAVFVL